ncbi:hypothetical protein GCM10022214_05420 [Actinomadura miaoliensis]|uniref:Transposase n=1 Tax=Actinomadura miaoliensis TaxID=430685 RepID=A0ABP7V034_9ACTN
MDSGLVKEMRLLLTQVGGRARRADGGGRQTGREGVKTPPNPASTIRHLPRRRSRPHHTDELTRQSADRPAYQHRFVHEEDDWQATKLQWSRQVGQGQRAT